MASKGHEELRNPQDDLLNRMKRVEDTCEYMVRMLELTLAMVKDKLAAIKRD
jgi:hypothetical protein